jgi:hypothetical protein
MGKIFASAWFFAFGLALARPPPIIQAKAYNTNDILKSAASYQYEFARMAEAHRLSAEYHRGRDLSLGVFSQLITAVLGTTVFVGLLSHFGVSGSGTFTIPQETVPRLLYFFVLALSVAGPGITTLRRAMHDAEDYASHLVSASAYAVLSKRLDIFVLRYSEAEQLTVRGEALDKLTAIVDEYGAIFAKSITLTAPAYAAGERELAKSLRHKPDGSKK